MTACARAAAGDQTAPAGAWGARARLIDELVTDAQRVTPGPAPLGDVEATAIARRVAPAGSYRQSEGHARKSRSHS